MELSLAEIGAIVALSNVTTGFLTMWVAGRKQRSDEDHNLFSRMDQTVKALGERVDELSKETKEQREELHILRTENAVLKEGRDGDKARISMLETINKAQQRELENMSKASAAFFENFRREGCPAGARCPMVGAEP